MAPAADLLDTNELTPPGSPRRGTGKAPRLFTSTPDAEKSVCIPRVESSVIYVGSSTPETKPTHFTSKVHFMTGGRGSPYGLSRLVFSKDEGERVLRSIERNHRRMTYRVEKMIESEVKSAGGRSRRLTNAPNLPDMTPVRRSPRLQKVREAAISNAKLCLVDDNNNRAGKVDAQTNTGILKRSFSRSAGKMMLDTSADVRNWCRAHSRIDQIASFICFFLFVGAMYWLASILHTSGASASFVAQCRRGVHSTIDIAQSAVTQIHNYFQ